MGLILTPYKILVVTKGSTSDLAIDFEATNHVSSETRKFTWKPTKKNQNEGNLELLRAAREYAWVPYLRTGPAPILKTWLEKDNDDENERTRNRRRNDNSTSMLAMLGGRAAIEKRCSCKL